jgi:hypothetical protein
VQPGYWESNANKAACGLQSWQGLDGDSRLAHATLWPKVKIGNAEKDFQNVLKV